MHVSSTPKILSSIVCILYLLEVWLWGSCLSSNRFHFQLSLLNFLLLLILFSLSGFELFVCILFKDLYHIHTGYFMVLAWCFGFLEQKKRTGPIGKLLLMLGMILVIVFGTGDGEWRSKACLAISLTYLLFWKVWMAPSHGIPERVGG